MTLVISALTEDWSAIVADRRVTMAPGLYEDRAKVAVMRWPGMTLLVAFTGLAEVKRDEETLTWLMKSIGPWVRDPRRELTDVLEFAAAQATERFRTIRFSPQDKRLSLMFSGYVDADPATVGLAGIVSNFEWDGATRAVAADAFTATHFGFLGGGTSAEVPLGHLRVLGANTAVSGTDYTKLNELIATRPRAQAFLGLAAEVIRRAAGNDPRHTIGTSLVGGVLPIEGAGWSTFDPDRLESSFFAPQLMMSNNQGSAVLMRDIEVSSAGGEAIAAPKQGRNEPCSCGSGKKYKRCHLALSQPSGMRSKSTFMLVGKGVPFSLQAWLPSPGDRKDLRFVGSFEVAWQPEEQEDG